MDALPLTQYSPTEPKVIGTLDFTCNDPYGFRMFLEIMSHLTTDGTLRFDNDGIYCAHCHGDRSAQIYTRIWDTQLSFYRVYPPGISGFRATTNMNKLIKRLKSYSKKDELTFHAKIYEGGVIWNVELQITENEIDNIPCGVRADDTDEYVNLMNKWYGKDKPTVKITNKKFKSTFDRFKHAGCTSVLFCLCDDAVIIKGLNEGVAMCATRCSLNGDFTEEAQKYEDNRIDMGGIILIVEEYDYKVAVNFSVCGEWLTKINRLSPATSILQIFIKRRAPLIIRSHVGTMAYADFTFNIDTQNDNRDLARIGTGVGRDNAI